MFIEKLSKKERLYFVIACAVVSLALLDRLIVSPINNIIHQITRNTAIGEKQLELYLRNISQKDGITDEYNKYVKNLKKSGSDSEEMTKILSEIEKLARNSSVYVSEIKRQDVIDKDFYVKYSIEMEAESDMKSLINFLHQLNTSNQLLRAERLRLSPKDKESPVVKSSILITKVVIP